MVLCVTGSIAAVETVRLARLLVRQGAEVIPVMTREAEQIISADALQFATGKAPVTRLTGLVEHISLLRREKCGVVIFPATANVLSKLSLGIADDAVTTLCLNALGMRIPLIVAPAMGAAMLSNPLLARNMERLGREGVEILPSIMEEEEAKVQKPEFVVETVIRHLSERVLARRHVLVIGGASEEQLDDVRFISSSSSGATAVEIATAAYEQGANVTMWCGRMEVEVPPFVSCKRFRSVAEILELSKGKRFDIVVVPASLSDFTVKKKKGKISSSSPPVLELESAPRILEQMRKKSRVLVGFKAEIADDAVLIQRARDRMESLSLDAIVANNLNDVTRDSTRAYIITPEGEELYQGGKRGLAQKIVEQLARMKK